jgi:hypothetical protein
MLKINYIAIAFHCRIGQSVVLAVGAGIVVSYWRQVLMTIAMAHLFKFT